MSKPQAIVQRITYLKTQKPALFIAIIFLLLFAVATGAYALYTAANSREFTFTSQLVDALDIDELSTSRLTYNGIVDLTNESGARYASISYNSTVKVGIKAEDIKFETDPARKTVRILLPAIEIQNPVIDASSINFIPDNPNVDTQVAIAACRADARVEAEQSQLLLKTAEENLKTIIEALTLPFIRDEGYTIVW